MVWLYQLEAPKQEEATTQSTCQTAVCSLWIIVPRSCFLHKEKEMQITKYNDVKEYRNNRQKPTQSFKLHLINLGEPQKKGHSRAFPPKKCKNEKQKITDLEMF